MIRLDRSSLIAKLCTPLKYNEALHGIQQQQPAKNGIVQIKICLYNINQQNAPYLYQRFNFFISSTCFELEVHLQEDGCKDLYGIVCFNALVYAVLKVEQCVRY
jgi:hypothetical protein